MGFLRRASPQPVQDPDQAAVERLRRAGADLTMPHQTRHFLYVPGVKGAQKLARALQRSDRRVEIETSARKGYWMVEVIQSMVVTPETIAECRAEFEAVAKPLNGEYDRWQVDVATG